MPKARRRKSGTRRQSKGWPFKSRRQGAGESVAAPNSAPSDASGEHLNGAVPNGPKPKQSFVSRLLANEGEGLFLLVSIAPLPIGAWIAGGMMLRSPGLFGLLICLVAVTRWIKLVRARREELLGANELLLVMYAGIVAISLCFFSVTDDAQISLLVALTGFLGVAFDRLTFDSVFSLFLGAATLVIRMSLLGVFGVYCQFPEFVLSTFVIGFVPGAVLASSLFAQHAAVMERHGWLRSYPHTDKKKGVTTSRPGGVSRAFSLALLVGPALPVALAPFYILPTSFVLIATLLYFIPGLCTAFIERTRRDEETALRVMTLAAAAAACVLLLGLIAPYV